MTEKTTPDYRVDDHGSIVLVTPLTVQARVWIAEHVGKPCTFYAGGLVVEPRYVEDLLLGMLDAGLTQELEV